MLISKSISILVSISAFVSISIFVFISIFVSVSIFVSISDNLKIYIYTYSYSCSYMQIEVGGCRKALELSGLRVQGCALKGLKVRFQGLRHCRCPVYTTGHITSRIGPPITSRIMSPLISSHSVPSASKYCSGFNKYQSHGPILPTSLSIIYIKYPSK